VGASPIHVRIRSATNNHHQRANRTGDNWRNVTVTGVKRCGYNGIFAVTAVPVATTFNTPRLPAGAGTGVRLARRASAGGDSVAALLEQRHAGQGGDYIQFRFSRRRRKFRVQPVDGDMSATTVTENVARELPGIVKLQSGMCWCRRLDGAGPPCEATRINTGEPMTARRIKN